MQNKNGDRHIPQWAVLILLTVAMSSLSLVYRSMASDLNGKADREAVAVIQRDVLSIQSDVDYLKRKASADLANDALSRRTLNAIAAKVGAAPTGPVVPVPESTQP